jgi:hypothetical protein
LWGPGVVVVVRIVDVTVSDVSRNGVPLSAH